MLAYGNIYSNQGAMTPGACDETADGMSEDKIDQIIAADARASGTGSPRPAASISRRRTGSSARSGCRPGQTSWSARWCACSWRRTTSRSSLAGRTVSGKGGAAIPRCGKCRIPGPGPCGLSRETSPTASAVSDHEILLGILAEKIRDNRFLRLIRNMLKAGYLEDWQYHDTLSGTPQGGVVSPVLSNIYLHKLDEFVERELIPQYTQGSPPEGQPANTQGTGGRRQAARQHGDRAQARELLRQMRALPYGDPMDPGYRRLFYCRYADDHLLGFIGPKAEAEQIKAKLAAFLRETLALELNAARR